VWKLTKVIVAYEKYFCPARSELGTKRTTSKLCREGESYEMATAVDFQAAHGSANPAGRPAQIRHSQRLPPAVGREARSVSQLLCVATYGIYF
jgi:hypothetical protein